MPLAALRAGDEVLVRPGETDPRRRRRRSTARATWTSPCSPASRCRCQARRATRSIGATLNRNGAFRFRVERVGTRHRALADHPAGAAGPGQQGADPAAGRPHLGGVRAGGAVDRDRDVRGLVRLRARAGLPARAGVRGDRADHRLPLRHGARGARRRSWSPPAAAPSSACSSRAARRSSGARRSTRSCSTRPGRSPRAIRRCRRSSSPPAAGVASDGGAPRAGRRGRAARASIRWPRRSSRRRRGGPGRGSRRPTSRAAPGRACSATVGRAPASRWATRALMRELGVEVGPLARPSRGHRPRGDGRRCTWPWMGALGGLIADRRSGQAHQRRRRSPQLAAPGPRDGHAHRRQPADGRERGARAVGIDARGGRGAAGPEAGGDPAAAGGGPRGGDGGRRAQRRARAGAGRRGHRDGHRHRRGHGGRRDHADARRPARRA